MAEPMQKILHVRVPTRHARYILSNGGSKLLREMIDLAYTVHRRQPKKRLARA